MTGKGDSVACLVKLPERGIDFCFHGPRDVVASALEELARAIKNADASAEATLLSRWQLWR